MNFKDIVVIYHGKCPDGFGGAYAAWKKFGDDASYYPASHGENVPEGLEDKEVYIIDFSYPGRALLDLEDKAKKLVVLDHHEGARSLVEQVAEHIFDNDRSGTGIAWGYFHPDTPLPRVLAYIQDNDLWRKSLPNYKEVGAYLSTVQLTFPRLDSVVKEGEIDSMFEQMIERGRAYAEYAEFCCETLVAGAFEVEFEGYTVLAVNAPALFRSQVGHLLAEQKPPFSITFYENDGKRQFSLRGNGTVDLAKLAQKYEGNGHHNAASFRLPLGSTFPFTIHKRT